MFGALFLTRCLAAPVLPNKAAQRSPIAESLCATFFCCGIRSSDVRKRQAVLELRSRQELADESGVETVSSTDIVHSLHTRRHEATLLLPRTANGCGRAAFHDHNLGQSC